MSKHEWTKQQKRWATGLGVTGVLQLVGALYSMRSPFYYLLTLGIGWGVNRHLRKKSERAASDQAVSSAEEPDFGWDTTGSVRRTLAFGLTGVVTAFGWVFSVPDPTYYLYASLAGIGVERLLRGKIARAPLSTQRDGASKDLPGVEDLMRALEADADERDEQLLKDLRVLAAEMERPGFWPASLASESRSWFGERARELFEQTVSLLEHQLEVGRLAAKLTDPEIRGMLEQERERILEQARTCLRSTGHLYSTMMRLQNDAKIDPAGLEDLRTELSKNLEIASRVEKRMSEWENRARESIRT